MYLLKLIRPPAPAMPLIFTFHYVSIKTYFFRLLLISLSLFTFHYVSIKTLQWAVSLKLPVLFTFHYVSIKTRGLK